MWNTYNYAFSWNMNTILETKHEIYNSKYFNFYT